MCGITGILTSAESYNLRETVHAMSNQLRHRGPDGSDVWCDEENGVAFGHRRLAIIDISEAGCQPMTSSCGRFVITYNGEVYNTAKLRDELINIGRPFKGYSDTEVILEAFGAWGIKVTLDRLIGMFAIGLWDKKEKELKLIRDRLGIKPLYWYFVRGVFMFASELKSFVLAPGFDRTLDRDAVVSFLRYKYIPAPKSIYQSVRKLEPGWMLSFRSGTVPDLKPYWSLSDTVTAGSSSYIEGSDEEVIDAFETILSDAVKSRMVSDVPLGAFLSGGIDSSTVVALMQKASASPVKTFSIGFNVPGYNEATHAAAVAAHLGTEHTELYVEPSQALDVIPKLAQIYDEPFADSSQIPTYLLSVLTRRHVTVSLSGDGGDELYYGYNRYNQAENFMRRTLAVPAPLRIAISNIMAAVPIATWNELLAYVPGFSRDPAPGDRIHDLATVLIGDQDTYYRRLLTHWEAPETLVRDGREVAHTLWNEAKVIAPDFMDRMQYLDTLTYLPDDILTKVDRASMAASLEARVPMLDHRVVEFSWRLPRRFKIRDRQSKWILRQLLYRYLPRSLVDRPKMGFGVPIGHWLREPLKEWAEELLSVSALNKFGIIDPEAVQKKWLEHSSGKRNWQYQLWNILMFQIWCEEWL